MNIYELKPLLADRWVLLGVGILAGLLTIWLGRRVRRIARSPRPDDFLANLFMVVGLGWSSEAIWEITHNRLHFPLPLTLLLFLVFELALVLSMIRATRHVRDFGWPGRPGRTTWIVASVMSAVAAFASHSVAEALLRAAIPLTVTLLWWDGLTSGALKRPEQVSSWRWTPRRLLLWLGAIEPGERDVETVHRERLTQQMVRLEFRRRHGSDGQKQRAADKLARLSLTADDEIIGAVRVRVDRAMWFENDPGDRDGSASPRSTSVSAAASARAVRVRHRRRIRTLRVTHPRPVIVAAQPVREDERATQDVDLVVRALKQVEPGLSQRRIAHLAATSDATVRRALRRTQMPEPTQQAVVNGRVPDLEEVRN